MIVLVVFGIGIYLYVSNLPSNGAMANLENVSVEEVDSYVDQHIDDFDEDMLWENILADINGTVLSVEFAEGVDNEVIDNYLLNEFDEQTLREALL